MFFVASKILWFVFQPSSLIALLLLLGLGLICFERHVVAGRRMLFLGAALLLSVGLSPLGNALIVPLENRVSRVDLSTLDDITGILVLGGAENGRISAARGELAMNEGGERFTETLVLARRYPKARIVFTGGANSILREDRTGAAAVETFFVLGGLEPSRIVLEDKSRNTHENALLTKRLVRPRTGDRWLLVTSAFHMPRALGVFQNVGFDVLPWPVDYRTKDAGDVRRPFDSISAGLARTDLVVKEWLGLLAYRLTGRTDRLFPM